MSAIAGLEGISILKIGIYFQTTLRKTVTNLDFYQQSPHFYMILFIMLLISSFWSSEGLMPPHRVLISHFVNHIFLSLSLFFSRVLFLFLINLLRAL